MSVFLRGENRHRKVLAGGSCHGIREGLPLRQCPGRQQEMLPPDLVGTQREVERGGGIASVEQQ